MTDNRIMTWSPEEIKKEKRKTRNEERNGSVKSVKAEEFDT
jgi:hypothetical protein